MERTVPHARSTAIAESPSGVRPASHGRTRERGAPARSTRVAACLVLFLALAAAGAQTLAVRAGPTSEGVRARVAVSAVPRAGGTADLAAVLSPTPGLDLGARVARSVAGVGTLTFEAEGGARVTSSLQARLRLTARGTIGPVAGRIEAGAWSAPAEVFDPHADPGPPRADAGADVRVAADYRLDGTWLLGSDVRGEWSAGEGAAVDVRLSGRARRALGAEWDLTGRLQGRFAPAGDGRVGLGIGVVHSPRRAPEVSAVLFLDSAPGPSGPRFAPGFETTGERPMADGRLAWTVRLRPLAPERAPWLVQAGWRRASDEGTFRVDGSVARGDRLGLLWAISAGYDLPIELR